MFLERLSILIDSLLGFGYYLRMAKIVLGVCAHPDDLEFGCGGSIAKWVREGATAYFLVLTDGSKGSEDPNITPEELKVIRRSEQEEAAKILGVKENFFLDYIDGELENNLELRKKIVRVIRQIKPDVVITMDPSFLYDAKMGFINHPDHRACGQATLDAIFPFARNAKTFPELLEEGLFSHNVKEVLLVNFQNMNYFVDITDEMETKLEAILAHKSQVDNPEEIQGFMRKAGKMLGKKINVEYAEGFVKINPN